MTNPIVIRELVGVLRTRKAVALQVLLLSVLALLVVLRWPGDARVNLSGEQAQQVLRVFGYGLMVAVMLLAPVFPATTIVRERIGGTLQLLLNSPLSPAAILWGKLAGVLGFEALLLVLSLPAATACFAMRGPDLLSQMLPLYLVLALAAVQFATLGLLVSSYAQSIDSALRMSYGAILALAVLSLGPHQFLATLVYGPMVDALLWVLCLSPVPAVMEALGQSDLLFRGSVAPGGLVFKYLVLCLLSIVLCVGLTWRRLSSALLDRPRSAGRITDERSAAVQGYRRIMFLWFLDPQRRGALIGANWPLIGLTSLLLPLAAAAAVWLFWRKLDPWKQPLPDLLYIAGGAAAAVAALMLGVGWMWLIVSINPVVVKEQKTRRFGRGNWMMRLIAACALVSMGLMLLTLQTAQMSFEAEQGIGALGGIMVVLQVALVVLLTPSLAGAMIAGERESGGWQLLQMTPMSAPGIVAGKLLSVGWTLLIVLLATLPGYAIMILIDTSRWPQARQVLLSLCLTAVFALLSTAAISSLFRRTAPATATAYALLVTLCAGTMLFWLGEDAPFSRHVVEAVLTLNPLAAALSLIEAPGFRDYSLTPGNWYVTIAGCLISLTILVWRTWRLSRAQ